METDGATDLGLCVVGMSLGPAGKRVWVILNVDSALP